MKLLDELAGGVAWILLIVGAALALHLEPAHGQQLRFEALGGACQYKAVGDGIWWNSKYRHALDMRDGCGLIAVSSVTPGPGMSQGWRLAYTSLGKARVDAVFPMVDHEQALAAFDGHACNGTTMLRCLGRGRGVQTAEGVSFGYVLEDSVGPVTLGLEAGLFAYDAAFDVSIARTPQNGHWVDLHFQGWQLTPFLGATARYGHLMAMARAYGRVRAAEHGCGGCSGVAGGPGAQLVIGLSVPF